MIPMRSVFFCFGLSLVALVALSALSSATPNTPSPPTGSTQLSHSQASNYCGTGRAYDPSYPAGDPRYPLAITFGRFSGTTLLSSQTLTGWGNNAEIRYACEPQVRGWSDAGTYNVRVKVCQDFGARECSPYWSEPLYVSVTNAAPQVEVSGSGVTSGGRYHSALTVYRGDLVGGFVKFSDADGDSASCAYRWGDGGSTPAQGRETQNCWARDAQGYELFRQYTAIGTYAVDAQLSDGFEGGTGAWTRIATVTVINRAPMVAGVSCGTGTLYHNTGYACAANVGDADGDSLACSVNFGDGTSAAGTIASGKCTAPAHRWTSPGSYLVTFTATDSLGASASASATAPMANREAQPVAGSGSAEPAQVPRNALARVYFKATDADGDRYRCRFDWSDTDTSESAWTESGALCYADKAWTTLGAKAVTVKIRDEFSTAYPDAAHAATTVNVVNLAPGLGAAPVCDTTTPAHNSWLRCTISLSDPDGDNVGASVAWGDGSNATLIPAGASGRTVAVSHRYSTMSAATIQFTPSDSLGAVGPASRATIVTPTNSAPGVTGSCNPAYVPRGGSTTCGFTMTDPEGDSGEITIHWGDGTSTTITNAGAGTRVSRTHAYPASASVGQTFTVTVSATDAFGASSASSAIATITVVNRAPSPVVIEARATTYRATDFSIRAGFTDPDGDPMTVVVRWGDGTMDTFQNVRLNSNEALTVSHRYTATGPFNLVVTTTDAYAAASQAAHDLQVLNRRPIAAIAAHQTGVFSNVYVGTAQGWDALQSYDPDGDLIVDWDWEACYVTSDTCAPVCLNAGECATLGPGQPSGDPEVHTNYIVPGVYVLRLRVMDAEQTWSEWAEHTFVLV